MTKKEKTELKRLLKHYNDMWEYAYDKNNNVDKIRYINKILALEEYLRSIGIINTYEFIISED